MKIKKIVNHFTEIGTIYCIFSHKHKWVYKMSKFFVFLKFFLPLNAYVVSSGISTEKYRKIRKSD